MTVRRVKPFSCFPVYPKPESLISQRPFAKCTPWKWSIMVWPHCSPTGCPSVFENPKHPSVTISFSPFLVIHSAWPVLPSLSHSPTAHLPNTYHIHPLPFPHEGTLRLLHSTHYHVLLLFFCFPILYVSCWFVSSMGQETASRLPRTPRQERRRHACYRTFKGNSITWKNA